MSSCDDNGAKSSVITLNHAHSLVIPAADFVNPVDGVYDIMGGAGHNHTVSLTAAQLMLVQGGTPVTVTSGVGAAHTHMVTVTCA